MGQDRIEPSPDGGRIVRTTDGRMRVDLNLGPVRAVLAQAHRQAVEHLTTELLAALDATPGREVVIWRLTSDRDVAEARIRRQPSGRRQAQLRICTTHPDPARFTQLMAYAGGDWTDVLAVADDQHRVFTAHGWKTESDR